MPRPWRSGVDDDVEHADAVVRLEPQPHRERPPDQLTRQVDGELERTARSGGSSTINRIPSARDDPVREVPGAEPGGGRDVGGRGHADRVGDGHGGHASDRRRRRRQSCTTATIRPWPTPRSPAARTSRARPGTGVDSEVGRLRTVMLHRPGPELKRLTPRNNDKLLFDGIPWVGRAQDEHDAFAQALRDHGVEVLYLADLLATRSRPSAARDETIAAVLPTRGWATTLRPDRRGLPARPAPGRPGDRADGRAGARGDRRRSAAWSTGSWTGTTSSSTRCPTCCSPATRACGSGTRSPSPAWPCRPGGGRPR